MLRILTKLKDQRQIILFRIDTYFNGMSTSKTYLNKGKRKLLNCSLLNLIFYRKADFLSYLLIITNTTWARILHFFHKCTVHCEPDFWHHGKLLEVAWVVGDSKKWGCSPFTIRWYDFVDHHLNPEFCWQARWNVSKSSGVEQIN